MKHISTENVKSAFTLVEILITIAIIGVVAAMTIPNLITNQRNKEFEVKLKKTYSELNQISKLFLEENEEPIPVVINRKGSSYMKTIFLSYMKGITKVDATVWNTEKDDEGNYVTGTYTQYYNLRGGSHHQVCDISGWFTTIDGRRYAYNDAPKKGENGPIICVDLNGSTKPNVAGLDYFLFIPTMDGTVIPMGQEDDNNTTSTELGQNCFYSGSSYCNKSLGYTCAYYAVNDKSPAGNGTYWKGFIAEKQYL